MCINLDACVSLMCELRSTELVINSSNKYSLLGIKKHVKMNEPLLLPLRSS